MAKRRMTRVRHRVPSRWRYRRRHHDKRIPLSVITGLTAGVFNHTSDGWGSVVECLKDGWFEGAAQSFMRQLTGIRLGGIGGTSGHPTEINWQAALNPFNLDDGSIWKVGLWTHLIARITRYAGIDPVSRIPMIGKFLKWS